MKKNIIIAASFILALLFAVLFVWPKYQNFRSLSSGVEAKNKELQSEEEYFSQLKQISEKLRNYSAETAKISSALPADTSLPVLFNFLQKTSSQSGLILKEINLGGVTSPAEKKEAGAVKEFLVDFEIVGSYPAFKNFLVTLEKSARLIEVQNLSFSSPEELSEPFNFEINIKTQSY